MRELKNRKIILFIIGEGEEREVLDGLIVKEDLGDKVFLLGFKESAYTLLKIFDIFILPSLKEGVPYVLLEAGLAERAIVASNVGSIPEVIEDNVNGLLVPPRDVEALAHAIDQLAGNAPKRTLFGKAIQEKVMANFSKEKMLAKTIELYLA